MESDLGFECVWSLPTASSGPGDVLGTSRMLQRDAEVIQDFAEMWRPVGARERSENVPRHFLWLRHPLIFNLATSAALQPLRPDPNRPISAY